MDALPSSVGSDSVGSPVILLGLGFTTTRLARRLLVRPRPVYGVVRGVSRFSELALAGLRMVEYAPEALRGLPGGAVIVHTIPPLFGDERENLRAFIAELKPRRVIYISSTGVYGDKPQVNAATVVSPAEPKGWNRVEEENWLQSGPWRTLILRAAGIYGPGRGIHLRVREGRALRSGGPVSAGVVSRIHAEDLASVLEAAVDSDVVGAWPCADEHPCSSQEVAEWCSKLLRLCLPESAPGGAVKGRRVDGSEIRMILGVRLLYSGYQAGVLASLAEEGFHRCQSAGIAGPNAEI